MTVPKPISWAWQNVTRGARYLHQMLEPTIIKEAEYLAEKECVGSHPGGRL